MTRQQNSRTSSKNLRFLWLTFEFTDSLPSTPDNITPQLFLSLMAHPAINQIKRFTAQADTLSPDAIAQWEPGLFTAQVYRPSLLEVLTEVSSQLVTQLTPDEPILDPLAITIYTQLDGRHYPITMSLSPTGINVAAKDIETMVQHYEKS